MDGGIIIGELRDVFLVAQGVFVFLFCREYKRFTEKYTF